jgi:hypothetical protein
MRSNQSVTSSARVFSAAGIGKWMGESGGDLRRAIASYADKLHTILYRAIGPFPIRGICTVGSYPPALSQ